MRRYGFQIQHGDGSVTAHEVDAASLRGAWQAAVEYATGAEAFCSRVYPLAGVVDGFYSAAWLDSRMEVLSGGN